MKRFCRRSYTNQAEINQVEEKEKHHMYFQAHQPW
jgi:hypothetical protein